MVFLGSLVVSALFNDSLTANVKYEMANITLQNYKEQQHISTQNASLVFTNLCDQKFTQVATDWQFLQQPAALKKEKAKYTLSKHYL